MDLAEIAMWLRVAAANEKVRARAMRAAVRGNGT
jgi:hypothetical protein